MTAMSTETIGVSADRSIFLMVMAGGGRGRRENPLWSTILRARREHNRMLVGLTHEFQQAKVSITGLCHKCDDAWQLAYRQAVAGIRREWCIWANEGRDSRDSRDGRDKTI